MRAFNRDSSHVAPGTVTLAWPGNMLEMRSLHARPIVAHDLLMDPCGLASPPVILVHFKAGGGRQPLAQP